MTPETLRRASAADAAALARLDAACFDVPWDERSLLSLLSGELTLAWCVARAETPVAYVLARVVAGEGEILRMGVAPGVRRQRLGATLLRAVMDELAPSVPHGLHLEVRAANSAARALYLRQGFGIIGLRPAYYADPPDDAVLMRWQPSRRMDEAIGI
jgi:[ribosomal protein S18]-alanine N-acetyltransferase